MEVQRSDNRAHQAIRTTTYILIFYLLPGLYIFQTFTNWTTMSWCFKREALINSAYLFYVRYADPAQPSFLLDLAQILAILWVVEKVNIGNVAKEPQCLYVGDSFYYAITHYFFKFLLWIYTVLAILMSILLIGLLAYGLLEIYYYRPRRKRRQGLSDNDFSKLKRIEFSSNDVHPDSTLDTCSICLELFTDKEILVQMPSCNHNFHEGCVKSWLKFHSVCPNCRNDIKTNIQQEQNPGQPVEDSAMSLEIEA